MIIIKIRGDSGEIRGKMLKPYVLDGVPTFGLNRGERFSLVLENTTSKIVSIAILEGTRRLQVSSLVEWKVAGGYDPQTDLWTLEPYQQTTVFSGGTFKKTTRIGIGIFADKKPFQITWAKLRPWRELIEELRREWAKDKIAGGLRASWQLFSRFED